MKGAERSSADPWRSPAGMPGSAGSRGDEVQGGRIGGALSSSPAISLPKGGGAIRRTRENVSANPGIDSLSGEMDKGLAQNREDI
jgi:hypothetical protein